MAAGPGTVRVRNLVETQRALRRTDRKMQVAFNEELRTVAEPVRSESETRVASSIRKIGPKWSRMRVGVTTKVVYVAPRMRSARSGPRKRPNLAPLMAEQMETALHNNAGRIEGDLGDALDRVANQFGDSP